MSKFRSAANEELKIETIKKACPICKGDIHGDDVYLFYCEKCNILFKRDELYTEGKEHIGEAIKERIAQRYEKGQFNVEEVSELPVIELSEEKKRILERRKTYYIGSKTSNTIHMSNCPFAKNIKKQNRIIYKTLEEKKNYKKCKCIT